MAKLPAPEGVSSLHVSVAPATVAVNANDGAVPAVSPDGPPVIDVSGTGAGDGVGLGVDVGVGAVATVKDCVDGDSSVLPLLVARTVNVYGPFAVVVYRCGEVHAAYVPGPSGRSSLHSKVEPPKVAWNVNDGSVGLMTPVGPSSIQVSGGEPSTTNNPEYAHVESGVPAMSMARTNSAYSTPPASGPRVHGDEHGSKYPGISTVSNRHSNVPGSVDENVNVGVSSVVEPTGPELIVVSGSVTATADDIPAASVTPTATARAPTTVRALIRRVIVI